MRMLRSFGAFWWDFIVGDDWLVAAAVVVGLVATWLVGHHTRLEAWWVMPAMVALVLPLSVRRLTSKANS
ncbi:hypothetical protein [Aestuariimicrobium sp. T2.26MG-19.2B]|uniref:hypothetical protein n=1 Tax=Aestuariimicrobium sp. T2.26MG-19.2B TaxID=3040679 RepID=UPI00247759C7|nr:hypothetical protein [Aestuariimicrobium sp. T2.26MG-19.2B]CAI9400874.1 hypothetical protein AESSP_00479 [Aestuariimicrobium sp. T2.26MG-19.2B]